MELVYILLVYRDISHISFEYIWHTYILLCVHMYIYHTHHDASIYISLPLSHTNNMHAYDQYIWYIYILLCVHMYIYHTHHDVSMNVSLFFSHTNNMHAYYLYIWDIYILLCVHMYVYINIFLWMSLFFCPIIIICMHIISMYAYIAARSGNSVLKCEGLFAEMYHSFAEI